MFTPYPSHTTSLAAALQSPCSIVGCHEHANPLNRVEAPLNIFGEPVVQVYFCEDHWHLLAPITNEQKVPDIVAEEQA